jgi:hypothetical protein
MKMPGPWGEELSKRIGRPLLFDIDQPLLAGAGIHEKAKRRGRSVSRVKFLISFLAVLVNLEIIF